MLEFKSTDKILLYLYNKITSKCDPFISQWNLLVFPFVEKEAIYSLFKYKII